MDRLLPGIVPLAPFRGDPLPGGEEETLPALPWRVVPPTAAVARKPEQNRRLSAVDQLQFMPGGDHDVTSSSGTYSA
jgi:hypothetical protein